MATLPTNWLADANGLGISFEGFGVEAGLDYFEFRLTGTAASNTSLLAFDSTQIISAAIGEDWTQSFYLWRVAGDFTGLSDWQIRMSERLEDGSFGDQQITVIVPTTSIQQFSHTRTLTGVNTFFLLPRLGVVQLGSGTVDVTMRVAAVTLRLSAPVVYSDAEIISIRRLPMLRPRFRSIVGYGKNYTVDSGEGVDTTATDAFKAFARQEFRTSLSTDLTVLTAHPQAQEIRVDTAILSKADADTEAARLQVLHGARRDMFEVELKSQPFAVDIGDVVTLESDRFNLSAGRRMIIVALSEDSATNEITVQVWG